MVPWSMRSVCTRNTRGRLMGKYLGPSDDAKKLRDDYMKRGPCVSVLKKQHLEKKLAMESVLPSAFCSFPDTNIKKRLGRPPDRDVLIKSLSAGGLDVDLYKDGSIRLDDMNVDCCECGGSMDLDIKKMRRLRRIFTLMEKRYDPRLKRCI